MTSAGDLHRRTFLIGVSAAAGGVTLGFSVPFAPKSARAEAPAQDTDREITCWVVIAPDDTVTIRVAHDEMGQGATTGLAMLVAEELECDWSKVRTEIISPEDNSRRGRIWGDTSTGASRSIASSQDYLRRAGATARHMLIAAAAARWQVPASECSASNSIVSHAASGRSLSFGALAADAAKVAPPADVPVKPPETWKLAGTPRKRLDVLSKITAEPIYAIDVRLPGMLYAAILQCPVFQGALQSVDENSIAGMKGVRGVVRMSDAVAVVADSWWRAKRAVDALKVTWDDRGHGDLSTAAIADIVRPGLDAAPAQVGRADGDALAALANATHRIEADYMVPFLAHATMEPQTCTAHVTAEGVEVWAPTQDSATTLATAAIAAGVPNEKVKVHRMFLGGGFGRRAPIQEFVRQSVSIAKQFDVPVKLLWSREQDVTHDLYRPFGMARLTAAFGPDGMPTALAIRLTGPSFVAALVPAFGPNIADRTFVSGLAEEMPYDLPNYLVDYVIRATPVPLGVWRAINYTQNAFYKECFIDEMAYAAGIDPYLFRRKLVEKDAKNLAVLDAAAQKAGWGTPAPPGVYRGIALNKACGSYCAQVVELSVTGGQVRVHRVVSALDMGYAVNPLSIEMQTQGAVVYALTAALYGEITIKNGGAEQSNFDSYQMMRIGEVPKVETVAVPSGGFWGGVGEPPVPPLAPALCNAIFAATGKRIRSLPVKNHDLRTI
ncbi:MAG TPA: molybdopterin cofactor-binding domain-containing protein [Xanthobacteraceae bacterium]|jgi:isoquinoline 1-oxidoreductase beta subunit|nr:molybdopterin cofactor-binding domain-containing protein [Xanthobacteraceae bacterium]